MTKALKDLIDEEKEFETDTAARRDYIKSAKRDAVKSLRILCKECGKRSAAHTWDFIWSEFYDNDTGSPNGGYWYEGSAEYAHIICPKCGTDTISTSYIYNRHDKERLLDIFRHVPINRIFDNISWRRTRG